MTPEERAIVKAGCLINYNRARAGLDDGALLGGHVAIASLTLSVEPSAR